MNTLSSCKKMQKEIKSYLAKPGDTLIIGESVSIVLTHKFKGGASNGLYDGGVDIQEDGKSLRKAEINAVCSLPDLPNWPEYDNIYGRWLPDQEKPGVKGGKTDWQLLIYFNGLDRDIGIEKSPKWAKRLAQNLCRKGDFKD